MFDWNVCLLTLQQVGILFAYLAVGFCLSRTGALPKDADKTMSKLVTLLFGPAYNIANLSVSMTPERLGSNLKFVGFGFGIILVALALAWGLSRAMGKTPLEKRSLTYGLSITNYGYFGYPLVAGVFGQLALQEMMVFCLSIAVITNTVGYMLFADKLSWKKIFLSPLVLAVFTGCALGVTGIQLPKAARNLLETAGNCMSPVSMILAGFVLGQMSPRELFHGARPWLQNLVSLVAIPAAFVAALYGMGCRGYYLLIPGVYMALPMGMNLVVFPASFGHDTRDNARLCLASFLLSLVTLPIIFSILTALM